MPKIYIILFNRTLISSLPAYVTQKVPPTNGSIIISTLKIEKHEQYMHVCGYIYLPLFTFWVFFTCSVEEFKHIVSYTL